MFFFIFFLLGGGIHSGIPPPLITPLGKEVVLSGVKGQRGGARDEEGEFASKERGGVSLGMKKDVMKVSIM
jgi:hypothetical protein